MMPKRIITSNLHSNVVFFLAPVLMKNAEKDTYIPKR